MNFNKLLPKSTQNKKNHELDIILYLFMVEFGWSYEDFKNTPIPILFRLLQEHKRVKEMEHKANKKKR